MDEAKDKHIPCYIIKKEISSWDGCNGVDTDEYFTNWIFLKEEKANIKCKELNKEYGHYGPGSSREYKVVKDYIID